MRRARRRLRRARESPLPSTAKTAGDKANEGPTSPPKQNDQARPPDPSTYAAARSGETLSDNVGAGIVQRSSRQPRQDRRRAAARPPHRSFGDAKGLRRSGAKRRRGLARSVPSARQRPGGRMSSPKIRAPRRPPRRRATNRLPVDLDRASGRAGARSPLKLKAPPKRPGPVKAQRRIRPPPSIDEFRRRPTPPKRARQPRPTCSPT